MDCLNKHKYVCEPTILSMRFTQFQWSLSLSMKTWLNETLHTITPPLLLSPRSETTVRKGTLYVLIGKRTTHVFSGRRTERDKKPNLIIHSQFSSLGPQYVCNLCSIWRVIVFIPGVPTEKLPFETLTKSGISSADFIAFEDYCFIWGVPCEVEVLYAAWCFHDFHWGLLNEVSHKFLSCAWQ